MGFYQHNRRPIFLFSSNLSCLNGSEETQTWTHHVADPMKTGLMAATVRACVCVFVCVIFYSLCLILYSFIFFNFIYLISCTKESYIFTWLSFSHYTKKYILNCPGIRMIVN